MANARLIAAAPDLLAACEAVMDYFVEHIDVGPASLKAYLVMRAAIRAARGGSDEVGNG